MDAGQRTKWILGATASLLVLGGVALLVVIATTGGGGERPEGQGRVNLAMLSHLIREWKEKYGEYPKELRNVEEFLAPDISAPSRERLFQDPWGRPINYRFPARQQSCDFDLYSSGPNGKDELAGGDDLVTDSDGRRPGCR